MTPKILLLLFIFCTYFSSACIPSSTTWCSSSNTRFETVFTAYGRGPRTATKTLYLYGTCPTAYAYARVQVTPTDYSYGSSSEYLQVYLDDKSSSTKTAQCKYMGSMSTTQRSFPPRVNCLTGFSMIPYIPSSASTSRKFVVRMYISSSVDAGISSSLSPYYLNASLELYCSSSFSSVTVTGGGSVSTVNTSSSTFAGAVAAAVWLCILLGVCLPCCLCIAVVGCMWMMGACCFAAASSSSSNRGAVAAAPLIATQETTVVTTQMSTQETTPYAPPQVTQQPAGQPAYNPQAGYVANPGVYAQPQYGQPQYGQPQYGQPPQYVGQAAAPVQQPAYQPYAQNGPPQYQPQYAPNGGAPPVGYPAQP